MRKIARVCSLIGIAVTMLLSSGCEVLERLEIDRCYSEIRGPADDPQVVVVCEGTIKPKEIETPPPPPPPPEIPIPDPDDEDLGLPSLHDSGTWFFEIDVTYYVNLGFTADDASSYGINIET